MLNLNHIKRSLEQQPVVMAHCAFSFPSNIAFYCNFIVSILFSSLIHFSCVIVLDGEIWVFSLFWIIIIISKRVCTPSKWISLKWSCLRFFFVGGVDCYHRKNAENNIKAHRKNKNNVICSKLKYSMVVFICWLVSLAAWFISREFVRLGVDLA